MAKIKLLLLLKSVVVIFYHNVCLEHVMWPILYA